ncbi:universal stress protein [uncultured Bacteroides sp.]|uniref:universal stress protein n=1 Tax=uncultured Bacteroides sp. TaxID=162156 RepID=UPI002AAA883C|nr:universal stress protein [uncultured Bacteroides sp.]
MEEKLVTLAILTYAKAQILKSVLEKEGIKSYIQNVDLIKPVVSSGVRLRIKESDLPHALKITESNLWLSEDIIGEKPQEKETGNKVLIPVDFSDYSMRACEFGFGFAKTFNTEVVLLHVYFTPRYMPSIPYNDVFSYQGPDEESIKNIIKKVNEDLNNLSEKIKGKIASGEFPDVKFTCVLKEGVPEEEILKYAKNNSPGIIVMGTRGKNKKDADIIGSVTAEVIDRSRAIVFVVPENTPFKIFNEVKKLAFITNFDQRDLIAFDALMKKMSAFKFSVTLIHLATLKDAWNEIKLAGIKEYFQKQYSDIQIHYEVVMDDNLGQNLDSFIQKNSIDVITITSYKRNMFARLFNPSIAMKMIFHTDTPLLVISDKI